MNSLILKIALRFLYPVMLVVSLLILFRGHHEPGGGFIGGLLLASALVLKTFVYGLEETERILRIKPIVLIIIGFSIAFIAAVMPLFLGQVFFTGLWADFYLPIIGRPGTPLLFDLGVYLMVVGVITKIVFSIGD